MWVSMKCVTDIIGGRWVDSTRTASRSNCNDFDLPAAASNPLADTVLKWKCG